MKGVDQHALASQRGLVGPPHPLCFGRGRHRGIDLHLVCRWSLGIFLVVAAVALALMRPLAGKYMTPKNVATNADRAIGKEAVVTEEIDNLKGQGAVAVCGVTWTARSDDDRVIPAGETVTVLRIEGVKLFVAPVQK